MKVMIETTIKFNIKFLNWLSNDLSLSSKYKSNSGSSHFLWFNAPVQEISPVGESRCNFETILPFYPVKAFYSER